MGLAVGSDSYPCCVVLHKRNEFAMARSDSTAKSLSERMVKDGSRSPIDYRSRGGITPALVCVDDDAITRLESSDDGAQMIPCADLPTLQTKAAGILSMVIQRGCGNTSTRGLQSTLCRGVIIRRRRNLQALCQIPGACLSGDTGPISEKAPGGGVSNTSGMDWEEP